MGIIGLGLWMSAAAWLLSTNHPRRTVLDVTDSIALLGHGALSVDTPVRLAISVALSFSLLVPLLTAVPERPRPGAATVAAAAAGMMSGLALWILRGRSQVVDFTAAAALGSLIGWLVVAGLCGAGSRRSTPHAVRIVAAVLLVSFLVAAGAVGFWHDPVDRGSRSELIAGLAVLRAVGAPSWLEYDGVEFVANIMFFVPLGVLLTLVLPPRQWWVAVVAGCCLSACIETGQAMFLPARTASLDDFAANSAGALFGTFLALATVAMLTKRWSPRLAAR